MTKKYSLAVIGATGNVGMQLLRTLEERNFPVDKMLVAASERSIGKRVSFGEKELTISALADVDFSKVDIAFFCAGSAISAQYAIKARKDGCIVIDKSSFFRLHDEVPLIVPEVNAAQISRFVIGKDGGIIANPNCCTIPLCVTMKPLDNAVKIERITAATYQSVSGAGKEAMDELYLQTKAKFVFEDIEPKALPSRIAFNLFPQIGHFRADGYSDEEYKIQAEVKKIMRDSIAMDITCVRVPVFVSHSIAVTIDFAEEFDAEEIEEILSEAESVAVFSTENEIKYATPIDSVESDMVYVSRVRNNLHSKKIVSMWICSDNLRKGAALNAVQIAERVIANS